MDRRSSTSKAAQDKESRRTSRAGPKVAATKSKGGKEGQGRGGRGRGKRKERPIPVVSWGAAQLAGEDNDGNEPLVIAVSKRHKEVARVLIDYEASLEATDPDGNTPLLVAVALSERTLVEDLLLAGASRDAENEYGAQALHLASHLGIRTLLQACAVEDLVAEAIKNSKNDTDSGLPPQRERTVYRIRMEGLPLLVLVEDVERVLEGLLRRVLKGGAVLPARTTVAADPITDRPLGYAYADFLEKDAAAELVRRKRNCRLGPRRVGLINEGARLEEVDDIPARVPAEAPAKLPAEVLVETPGEVEAEVVAEATAEVLVEDEN